MGALPHPLLHCIKAHETIQAIPSSWNRAATAAGGGGGDSATAEAGVRSSRPGNNMDGIHRPPPHYSMASVAWAFDQWITTILFLDPITYHDEWVTTPFVSYLGGINPFFTWISSCDDFRLLAWALGRTNVTLSHKNGSKHRDKGYIQSPNPFNVTYKESVVRLLERPYRELYTPRAREIVERHFESDLSAFGYQF